MPDMEFNTTAGQTVDRELLIAYLNTGEESTPEWSPLGTRVTDSSMEYDWQEESAKDILGTTRTSMKKPIITKELEAISQDAKAIEERFYKDLEFGDQGAECCCSRKPGYADCPPICRHSQNRRVCGAIFRLYG